MRVVALAPAAPALALALLVLAGCGGGGDSAPLVPLEQQPVEYRGGYAICSIGSVEYVAQRYGVKDATPDAVADTAAAAVGYTSPESAANARRGCLAAIAARNARGPGNQAP